MKMLEVNPLWQSLCLSASSIRKMRHEKVRGMWNHVSFQFYSQIAKHAEKYCHDDHHHNKHKCIQAYQQKCTFMYTFLQKYFGCKPIQIVMMDTFGHTTLSNVLPTLLIFVRNCPEKWKKDIFLEGKLLLSR